jgi:type IV secretion system protein VirB4
MNALTLKERPVSHYVPYSHHVTDEIIADKGNEYLAVIKVSGRSAMAASLEDQNDWLEALHNVLRGLPLGKLGLYTHTVGRYVTEYPNSQFSQVFARQFDDSYRGTFNDKNALKVNALYLTVSIHPVADELLGMMASLEKASPERLKAWQAESIEDLKGAVRAILAGLHRYDAEVLKIVDRNGFAFSEPGEFFGFLLSGEWHAVPVTDGYLWDSLPSARPVFSRYGELGEIRTLTGTRKFGMLELFRKPGQVRPGHLDSILSSPYEYVITQSWGSFTNSAAKKLVKKHKKLLQDSNDDAPGQVKQLKKVIEKIETGDLGLGDHHATMLIWGDDADSLRRSMSDMRARFADRGLVVKPLEKALEAGFWSQLPANWSWRTRPVAITSENFLCLNSFHNQLSGKATGNPWGPAVTMFKSIVGAPFFFNYHVSLEEVDETGQRRPGNTLIIGYTGTGKTVLQGVLLTQAQKFGATALILDKDEGLHVLVLALRGQYFTLRLGLPTGWQPFQLDPTPKNMAFMRQLVAHLAGLRGETVSTKEAKDIAKAVEMLLLEIDKEDRGIHTLLQYLPDYYQEEGQQLTLHKRLLPWRRDGEYGWVFDNPTDRLNLEVPEGHNPIFGFDLTEILDDEHVRGAATMYIRHRSQALHDGRRIINLVDECQHPLKDKHYQDDMQDAVRTIRKKNGVLAFSTQEPEAIAENPVGPSIIQQAGTLIFLPNPRAKRETYMKDFGLSAREFELVKQLGEKSRQFVVNQGSSVTVAELDLSTCPEALLVFSGSPDMATIAKQVIAEVGDDPATWLPLYVDRAEQARKGEEPAELIDH